ncbi:MAG TPA: hypothetical protein PLD49_09130, partial [Thermoclostridium caenicola]|uniref:hypothetical protein n=1 Tax=Thermoclostridium caenicola TaxID=659425 RepID=UPI002BB06FC2
SNLQRRCLAKSYNKLTPSLSNKNLDELQEIAAATEEQLASMQQVASSVGCIENMSRVLMESVAQ